MAERGFLTARIKIQLHEAALPSWMFFGSLVGKPEVAAEVLHRGVGEFCFPDSTGRASHNDGSRLLPSSMSCNNLRACTETATPASTALYTAQIAKRMSKPVQVLRNVQQWTNQHPRDSREKIVWEG